MMLPSGYFHGGTVQNFSVCYLLKKYDSVTVSVKRKCNGEGKRKARQAKKLQVLYEVLLDYSTELLTLY